MAEDKKIEVLDITNKVTTASPAKLLRNLIVVGCGDGGVNIMNGIRTKVPEAYTVAYNSRIMEGLQSDVKITPQRFDGRKVDGSGKDREYSKKILKAGSHQILMSSLLVQGRQGLRHSSISLSLYPMAQLASSEVPGSHRSLCL